MVFVQHRTKIVVTRYFGGKNTPTTLTEENGESKFITNELLKTRISNRENRNLIAHAGWGCAPLISKLCAKYVQTYKVSG